MKRIFAILSLFIASSLFSQKEKVMAYIEAYKQIAMQEMKRTGVPAAITLAQGILESKFGESELSKKSNNHFGIKCKTEWTGEKVYHDDDERGECFRKYNTIEESFRDHSDFLRNRPYYTSLFNLDPTDAEAWAKGLKQCGYATERDYPEKLMKLITEYNLNQYTYLALNKRMPDAQINNTAKNTTLIQKPDTYIATQKKESILEQEATINLPKPTTTIVKDEEEIEENKTAIIQSVNTKNNNYPTGIFTINGTKVIFAKQGTAMLSLANEYNISLSKLLEYNDLSDLDFVDEDRLIYLERKQKKGSVDFYEVQENEDLHFISQKLGIQLQTLAEFNGLNKKLNPATGVRLYLKAKAPIAAKTK
jgi:hypothetical protein